MPRRSPVFGTPEERLLSFLLRDPQTGCLLFTGAKARGGYGKMTIYGRPVDAHILAYELWVDSAPRNGLLVCHTCDTPPCCERTHLFLGTHADNSADMKQKGRSAQGSKHWRTKITEDDVREIRSSTESNDILAARMEMTERNIRRIRSGERWAHVS